MNNKYLLPWELSYNSNYIIIYKRKTLNGITFAELVKFLAYGTMSEGISLYTYENRVPNNNGARHHKINNFCINECDEIIKSLGYEFISQERVDKLKLLL